MKSGGKLVATVALIPSGQRTSSNLFAFERFSWHGTFLKIVGRSLFLYGKDDMELEWAIDVLFRIVNYEISFFAWFEMV